MKNNLSLRLKILKILQSILAGLIGVQHSSKMQQDADSLKAHHFIIFGIIALIIFIITLSLIVIYVTQ